MPRDPYWITARRPGKCAKCGEAIPVGAHGFYIPNSRTLYGAACCGAADEASRRFDAERADEAQYAGHW